MPLGVAATMIRATLAAVLVLAVVPPFAYADVYTWTDAKGVLNLSGNKPHLRDELRAYFLARSEDSVEL